MPIWFHRYRLIPRRRLSSVADDGPREGALLRIDDGFADLHPWPELGDLPLDAQLARLARGEPTGQARASLALAAADGEARARDVSLFDGLTIPESHWPGADPPDGFDTVKIKRVTAVPEHVRIRIDFNATLTPEEFLGVARALPFARDRIDFIEDPCPYDARVWTELRERSGLRLALDRGIGLEGYDVLVHKPALSAGWPTEWPAEWPVHRPEGEGELVVTSYMDHAVGQCGAAYLAASHAVQSRCGLMTHVLYEPDAFFDRIERDGARLRAPHGTGIGFDDLLESLPWQKLA